MMLSYIFTIKWRDNMIWLALSIPIIGFIALGFWLYYGRMYDDLGHEVKPRKHW